MVGGVKSHSESSLIPTKDTWRAQTNFVAYQDPTTPQRLSQNCVWVSPVEVWVSSGLLQGKGSACSRPWCGISPLGGRHLNLTTEPPELTLGWWNKLLEGTKKTLFTPGPRRKEQCPHKRLIKTCLWVSRSLQQRHGSAVACCRAGGTECGSVCMGSLEGGRHSLHYLHHSLASGPTTGREHSTAHQQKIRLKIYWAWSHP